MTFFNDSPWQIDAALMPDRVSYYRRVLELHATDQQTAACAICRVARCRDWVDAFDTLAAAGQLMTQTEPWRGEPARSSGRNGRD